MASTYIKHKSTWLEVVVLNFTLSHHYEIWIAVIFASKQVKWFQSHGVSIENEYFLHLIFREIKWDKVKDCVVCKLLFKCEVLLYDIIYNKLCYYIIITVFYVIWVDLIVLDMSIIKRAEHQRTDAFELWCWRRFLRVP